MKHRSILAGALALVLSASCAFAQTNQGTSPLTPTKGGTNSAFIGFAGPASSIKTFTLPNASDTIATLAAIQTFSAAKTFNNATLLLAGSSSGTTTVNATAAASGTITLPAATDTLIGKATTDTLTNKTFDTAGSGNALSINGVAATANTGTGSVVRASSPTLVTPTLGAALATSLNGNTFTTGTYTLTGTAGKTLTFSNSLNLAGTDGTTLTFQGTDTYVGRATTDTLTNKTLTSPTLTTPALGVATATSINKVAITAPASSATLTIPDGVTLTGPASSGTAMTLGNTETVTGVKTFGSSGAVGRFKLAGTTSGSTVVDASATASGTLTLPAATDTLVGKATTDVLTNKTFNSTATGNVLQVSGVTVSAGQYPGEPSTGNATAGNIREYVESVIAQGSAVPLVTGTPKDITTISLTAGDWEVRAVGISNPAGTTSQTFIGASISTGAANSYDATSGRFSQFPTSAFVSGGVSATAVIPPYRLSLSGTTTVRLVGQAGFTVSTMSMYGILSARRL